MKLDKKTLDMLKTLPDEKLWQMLRVVALSIGVSVPDKMPDADKMAGFRAALDNIGDGDLERATEIIDIYKGGKGNGKRK